MTNSFEFLLMFLQILVGFGSVCQFLYKICKKLDTKQDKDECRYKREHCPLIVEIQNIKKRLDK